MDQAAHTVNTVAPLQNVARCMTALQKAMERPEHLPGLIALYGPSGWGKSTAAAYAANKYRAYYVEAKSTWSRKALLEAILIEMGINKPKQTIPKMAMQAAEQLAISGRPLIVDEFDYIVEKGMVELIRDLYESSGAPILIIGEENLETNLRKWERFHNRMLDWVPAEQANITDAMHLRRLYCKNESVIADDLLQKVLEATHGTVRRICVNLAQIEEHAQTNGLETVTLADWGNRPLFTGAAPKRKVR